MRKGCSSPFSKPPPPKVPPPCPSRWSSGGRGKGHGSYFEKFFFGVGERRMPLKATLDRQDGDDEAGRLEPR